MPVETGVHSLPFPVCHHHFIRDEGETSEFIRWNVGNLVVAESLPQPVKNGYLIRSLDPGTAAHRENTELLVGIGAGHKNVPDLFGIERQGIVLVLEEDHSFCRCLPGHAAMFLCGNLRLRKGIVAAIEKAQRIIDPKHPADLVIDL